MKRLMHLLPTVAVALFMSLGHSNHFNPALLGPLGTLLILPLAVALAWPGRPHPATPIDWALSFFVGAGGLALWISPATMQPVMEKGAEPLIYFLLLLVAVVPPLLGRRPFTEYYARAQHPKELWQNELFLTINRHMTWVWAGLFFLALVSSVIPLLVPALSHPPIHLVFRLAIPMILMLGGGWWFNRWYPEYYMQKTGSAEVAGSSPSKEEAMSRVQDITSAKEMIAGMPGAFNSAAAGDLKAVLQFEISGDEEFTAHLAIADGACSFVDGPADSPDLVVQSPADVWLGIAKGEINGQAAFMSGQFKAQGNMGLLLQMNSLFPAG